LHFVGSQAHSKSSISRAPHRVHACGILQNSDVVEEIRKHPVPTSVDFMAQVFHRSTNTLSKVSIFGAVFLLAFVLYLILEINQSPYVTRAGEVRDHPI